MDKLRVGVIGLGMGKGHIEGYGEHPAAEVVAVADPDRKRIDTVADMYRIRNRYSTGEEMIRTEKLDVVSVVTPNKFHKPLTIAALKAGAHVLCEKPMAMNAREAAEMIAAAKKAKRRLMINFSYRFSREALSLEREVRAGALGRIYFARTIWHRNRGIPGFGGWFGIRTLSGGGPLIDLGVHRLDLALWLMGYPKPVWVLAGAYNHISSRLAKAAKKKFDVEDLAVGLVRFADGATLEIEASWATNIAEQELMETRLMGTEGGLVQRNLNAGYEFEAEMYREKDGKMVTSRPGSIQARPGGAMFHFIDCIKTGTPHIATGEEGLTVMKLLDAIYASAKKGKPVSLR